MTVPGMCVGDPCGGFHLLPFARGPFLKITDLAVLNYAF